MPDGATNQKIPIADLNAAKARISLSGLIGRDIALKKHGKDWYACCPFHGEKSASFTVVEHKGDHGFYHCHGCGAHGDHIAWLMAYHHIEFKLAYEQLSGERVESHTSRWVRDQRERAAEFAENGGRGNPWGDDSERAEMERARVFYDQCKPLGGTVAHDYLRHRKLIRLQQDWRFHPNLKCVEVDRWYPALVVPLRDRTNRITAVQRIWIDPATLARPLNPENGKKVKKKTWGMMGDSAVRCGAPDDVLGIAEGPEKAQAVKQIFATPCWAACGAARLKKAALWIPPTVKKLIIFADYDDPDPRRILTQTTPQGEVIERPNPDYGKRVGLEAARAAAAIYGQRDIVVITEYPLRGGKDWSEVLEQGLV